MYTAIKNFLLSGKEFEEGDEIPQKYISEYLINSGKIKENTTGEILLIDNSSNVIIEENFI